MIVGLFVVVVFSSDLQWYHYVFVDFSWILWITDFTGCFWCHSVSSSPKVTVAAWESGGGAVRTLDTLACVAGPGDKVGPVGKTRSQPPRCSACFPLPFPSTGHSLLPSVPLSISSLPTLSFLPIPEASVVSPTYYRTSNDKCAVRFTNACWN